ncbi:MAG TPA: alpha-amylase family glycosyl hydrolase, partial [Bacteroidota bacterium]|nr:alpha-amylase family glycosyl hydrolase [Bacteroidota bacterium]
LPPDFSAMLRGRPGDYPETENFTHDTDWMPNVVLLAKNVYVWLDQLSRRFARKISRLDEIPDEELDRIAGWNFTSLWLIGIWSRSPASEKIKKMTGNPEAAPSAYSVFEYEIAPELGGETAFGNLAHRAWQRGIRLAADMVPNHTGLTSRWIARHPEYFIQSEYPPFPGYRFTGRDLSDNPDYQVRIEDGYWTRTDAAVVFQHVDNRTGRLRYIYHGNDGTNMPWNDTAQLDFLKAEVREAVIGQILHVAKKFSVIRFDAAMTLAKKHFHRLWYPQPGTGGDIPSRSDHGMWQEDFDAVFPTEFWREVVDRINREMPQTLLLAEAFWLLEGYFVRTLGMHRVYNSAFMHMLMKEDNAMYREAIRSTLHFEPEILKRYVNFMSNPDEHTALDQFGKGDKYFGIATLMVTLPGLPMFSHGQVEGFGEKYGMEYRRAYRNEAPDADLVRRHEREIFPLLRMRHLFSQTADFELFDVVDRHGQVIQDIYAFSNMSGGERAIVCYNNRYESYAGRIHVSAGKLPPSGGGVGYRTLGEALRMKRAGDVYYIFREHRSGLEFIRPGTELLNDGMRLELGAFQSKVFLDFREVRDTDGKWGRLCRELEGRGVHDIGRAADAIRLRPFHEAFGRLLDPLLVASVSDALAPKSGRKTGPLTECRKRFAAARDAMDAVSVPPPVPDGREGQFKARLGRIRELLKNQNPDNDRPPDAGILLAWLSWSALASGGDTAEAGEGVPDLLIDLPVERAFMNLTGDAPGSRRKTLLVDCLVVSDGLFRLTRGGSATLFGAILRAPKVRECIGANQYEGVEYFNKESFEELAGYLALVAAMHGPESGVHRPSGAGTKAKRAPGSGPGGIQKSLLEAAALAGYKLGDLARRLESVEFLTLTGQPGSDTPAAAGGTGGSKRAAPSDKPGKSKKK